MEYRLTFQFFKKRSRKIRERLHAIRPNSVYCFQTNLNSIQAVKFLGQQVIKNFGYLDALTNNASAFYPRPFEQCTQEDRNTLINTNLTAAFFLSQATAKSLKLSKESIINLLDAKLKQSLDNYIPHYLAKGGLKVLTGLLAKELAPEVQVNGVSLGTILFPIDANFSGTGKKS